MSDKTRGSDDTLELILWRHAEAEDGFPDAQRRLTARGEKQAKQIAKWLKARLPKGATILVSPTLRTQQTAKALGPGFETTDQVGPGADAADLLAAAGWPQGSGAVLIVGHQPTLGRLASRLLSGTEADWGIKKGAVWWFSSQTRGGESRTVLRAVIGPDLLG